MLPKIQFIDPALPHSVARSLQSTLVAERFLVTYLLALTVISTALWLKTGDVVITSLAMSNVVLIALRIGFSKLCSSTSAYLPILLAIGVVAAAQIAALIVRAFSLGDDVAIALVALAASAHLSGVTIRGAAAPALAIPNVSTLFALLIVSAIAARGFYYWVAAILLALHWIGTLQLINMMHGRVRAQLLAEYHMARSASTDALTGLANRAAFDGVLTERLASGAIAVVAMIDLDRFKAVNDTHGHDAGDELLKSVATRILAELDDRHLVARLGGDEFAVLFDVAFGVADASRAAERIVLALERPFMIATNSVTIGASIGLAAAVHGDSARSLKRRADDRLYDVKRGGRGHVAYESAAVSAA
ncbi:diguanylate cyclase (GGDEF)-like protein [Nitrobacteraceae bacterium AZCC 1564]